MRRTTLAVRRPRSRAELTDEMACSGRSPLVIRPHAELGIRQRRGTSRRWREHREELVPIVEAAFEHSGEAIPTAPAGSRRPLRASMLCSGAPTQSATDPLPAPVAPTFVDRTKHAVEQGFVDPIAKVEHDEDRLHCIAETTTGVTGTSKASNWSTTSREVVDGAPSTSTQACAIKPEDAMRTPMRSSANTPHCCNISVITNDLGRQFTNDGKTSAAMLTLRTTTAGANVESCGHPGAREQRAARRTRVQSRSQRSEDSGLRFPEAPSRCRRCPHVG